MTTAFFVLGTIALIAFTVFFYTALSEFKKSSRRAFDIADSLLNISTLKENYMKLNEEMEKQIEEYNKELADNNLKEIIIEQGKSKEEREKDSAIY